MCPCGTHIMTRTRGREKRAELGISRGDHFNQKVKMMRRWADAPEALSLLAPRSPQRRPSGGTATLRPLPTCLREGPSSEWAWLFHQSTSPRWTVGETEVPRGAGTRPKSHSSPGAEMDSREQFPASQMLPIGLLLTTATTVTLHKAATRGLQDPFPTPVIQKLLEGTAGPCSLVSSTQHRARRRDRTKPETSLTSTTLGLRGA